jgi:hypothetical protein
VATYSRTQDIAEQGCVTSLLISHKLDHESILCSQSSSLKLGDRESSKAVVEKIKLDPFLVQGKGQ